jgi:hypothetical protein
VVNAVTYLETCRIGQIPMTLIDPTVRGVGWGLELGLRVESDMLGPVHTFRITDPREREKEG